MDYSGDILWFLFEDGGMCAKKCSHAILRFIFTRVKVLFIFLSLNFSSIQTNKYVILFPRPNTDSALYENLVFCAQHIKTHDSGEGDLSEIAPLWGEQTNITPLSECGEKMKMMDKTIHPIHNVLFYKLRLKRITSAKHFSGVCAIRCKYLRSILRLFPFIVKMIIYKYCI